MNPAFNTNFSLLKPAFHPGIAIQSKSKSKKVLKKLKQSKRSSKFNFLPKDFFPPPLTSLLCSIPISPLSENLKSISSMENGFYFSLPTTLKREKDEFQGAVKKIKSLRNTFKTFLHFYRFRKLKQSNKKDIVTGETPKYPIWIVDWKQGQKWLFEAKTLMSDITFRLQHHDGFFEMPLPPRNPYTNIPLTLTQNISIWLQFSFSSLLPPSTSFCAFRSVKWYLPSFQLVNSTYLQKIALKETMNDYTSYDFQDRMIDFIRYVFNDQDHYSYPEQSFIHAVENHMDEPYMIEWKKYCYLFWLAPILHKGNSKEVQLQQHGVVNIATSELVPKKHIVVTLRNLYLKK